MRDKDIREIRLLYNGTVETPQILYFLGMSILTEHFRAVHDFVVYGTGHLLAEAEKSQTDGYRRKALFEARTMAKEYRESFALITGTGFNIIIESYGLGMNPDYLRDQFLSHCEHARQCQTHGHKSA